MAITIEQIHQTADQLHQEGIKPTQMNVRERLGGGSFSTIAEGLKSWRVENETIAQLQAVVIPQDITDRTQVLIAQVWETAQAIANERLTADREALAVKENLLVAENDELQTVVKTLERENVELTSQLDETGEQLATATERANDLALRLEQSTADREALAVKENLLVAENDELQTVVKTLERENVELTSQLDETGEQLATATERANDLALRLEQSTADHKADQEKSENLMQDLTKSVVENATLKGRNDTIAEQLAKFETLTQAQAEKIEKLTADLATAHATVTKAPTTKPKTTRTPKAN